MENKLDIIKKLKEFPRENFFFFRRRIQKSPDTNKKTLGWILQEENKNNLYENKNYDILHNQKLLLENDK